MAMSHVGMGPDRIRAYFWHAVNKRPGTFWLDPMRLVLNRTEKNWKLAIFRGNNFPNPNQRWLIRVHNFWPGPIASRTATPGQASWILNLKITCGSSTRNSCPENSPLSCQINLHSRVTPGVINLPFNRKFAKIYTLIWFQDKILKPDERKSSWLAFLRICFTSLSQSIPVKLLTKVTFHLKISYFQKLESKSSLPNQVLEPKPLGDSAKSWGKK